MRIGYRLAAKCIGPSLEWCLESVGVCVKLYRRNSPQPSNKSCSKKLQLIAHFFAVVIGFLK